MSAFSIRSSTANFSGRSSPRRLARYAEENGQPRFARQGQASGSRRLRRRAADLENDLSATLEPNGKVFLQGWALVENTSDDDWNDVRMVLVSGRPISFQMNLYEPLYMPRPMVEPELFASLRPPVYAGAMGPVEQDGIAADGPQSAGGSSGNAGDAWAWETSGRQEPGPGSTAGSMQNQMMQNTARQNAIQNTYGQNKLSYEELQQRRQQQVARRGRQGEGELHRDELQGRHPVGRNGRGGGRLLPVRDRPEDHTLSRQKSAMLPIIDQTIEGPRSASTTKRSTRSSRCWACVSRTRPANRSRRGRSRSTIRRPMPATPASSTCSRTRSGS